MPTETKNVLVRRGGEMEASGGQTRGMIRQNAFVDVSDKICALRMIADPHTSSDIHHHGDLDTIIYAVKGYCTLVSEGGNKKQTLAPGDFAMIPAFVEHQEVNDTDEEVVLSVVRSGREPTVVNLKGWGTS